MHVCVGLVAEPFWSCTGHCVLVCQTAKILLKMLKSIGLNKILMHDLYDRDLLPW